MTRSTRKLQNPASLLCGVHKMVFGTLVAFLVAMGRNWTNEPWDYAAESLDLYGLDEYAVENYDE